MHNDDKERKKNVFKKKIKTFCARMQAKRINVEWKMNRFQIVYKYT